MIIRIILISAILLEVCTGRAQEFYSADSAKQVEHEQRRHAETGVGVVISFKVGAAIPTGSFSSDNVISTDPLDSPGFAKDGIHLGIELEAHSKNLFLFGLHLDYTSFNYNTEPYEQAIFLDSSLNGFSAGSWRQIQPLLALGVQHEVGNLGVELKMLGGVSINQSPETRLNFDYLGIPITQVQLATNSSSLALGLGFGMRYHFNSFFLKAYSEYIATTANFIMETQVLGLGQNFSLSDTYTHKLANLRSGLSIGFKF
ncbi:MAG: hypothetical protein KDC83_04355 [Flavobacteriales bacterium]|nr:hypothetical protein [Flavobacteriales bacterium]